MTAFAPLAAAPIAAPAAAVGGAAATVADVWGYVLSNGMTAEEALVAVYTALHKEGGVLTVGKFLGLK